MSDASREADGYEVERSSADQHTADERGAEDDARPYDRIRAVIDWFETVPSKARNHEGALVGHYVEAADWRAVRSELNSIANATRVTPRAVPATPDAGDATEGLSEVEREALIEGVCPGHNDPDTWHGICAKSAERIAPTVERIIAARVSAAATKARAEERERIAQAIEAKRDALHEAFPECKRGMGYAARIARLAPDTAGGDR